MGRLDGYVGNMEYVHDFCREMSPAALNFVLTMQGIEPVPLEQGFTYCDLGCGQGLSTNLFASCHPEGQFHAIDFNHSHIVGARRLADQARLDNVTFREAAFDSLDKLNLPEFDFITLHGVYSWISAENRKHIVDFIRSNLKTGGAVYLSYNCLPGWSSIAPVRRLLVSCTDMAADLSEEQINASVEFVGRMKSMNLAYFKNNPSSAGFFDQLSKRSRNYLAHEYFNQHWDQFYHADVVRDMSSAGLSFACSATIGDNLDSLRFTLTEQQLLDSIKDPVQKETVKDFAVNQQFRRDVFTRRRNNPAQKSHQGPLSLNRFAKIVAGEKDSITLNSPRSETSFDPELFKYILRALNEQHSSLEELLQISEVARFGSEKTYQALMALLASGYILPAADPPSKALISTALLNYAILEQMIHNMEPQHLASPVVRSGIQLDWVQRLLLLCELTDCGEPFSFVSNVMYENNYALIKDGITLRSWDKNLEELDMQITAFHSDYLPLLKRLGVI